MATRRVATPPMPAPAEKYDRANEAAFRQAIERGLQELSDAANSNTASSEDTTLASALAALQATVAALQATITPSYGAMHVHEGSTAQTGISGDTKLTCFSSDGEASTSQGSVVPDPDNDEVGVTQDGDYFISVSFSFSGSVATDYHFHGRINDVHTEHLAADARVSVGGSVANASLKCIIPLEAGDAVAVSVVPDSSANLTMISASFVVIRVGPTLIGGVA